MKMFLLTSLMITTVAAAETLDFEALRSLLIERKATLESVHIGMSKRIVTLGKQLIEDGEACSFKQTSEQSILKVSGEKVLIFAKEIFQPANSPACANAGLKPHVEKILYYEAAPSLTLDLADLDETKEKIVSIDRSENSVTISLEDDITVIYDLSKSSFNNLISTVGKDFKSSSVDLPDLDLKSLDLKNVKFCENNDENDSDCVLGDYSDIIN